MTAETLSVNERRKGTAVWKQVEQVLVSEIWDGQFNPGDRLPSEQALADRFGVNRHTIRRTLSELVSQNIVRVENGRGAFIREDVLNYRVASSSRFWEGVALDGRSPSVELVASGIVPASRSVAKALSLAEGEQVTFLESIGRANGEPVVLARHYFPLGRFPDLIDRHHQEGRIRSTLESYGVSATRRHIRVNARMPRDDEASVFGWLKPMLVVDSIYVDETGVPVDFGVARYVSGRVQLDFDLEEEAQKYVERSGGSATTV